MASAKSKKLRADDTGVFLRLTGEQRDRLDSAIQEFREQTGARLGRGDALRMLADHALGGPRTSLAVK